MGHDFLTDVGESGYVIHFTRLSRDVSRVQYTQLFPIYLCSPSVRGHSPSRLSKWLLMRLLKSPSVPSGTSLFF